MPTIRLIEPKPESRSRDELQQDSGVPIERLRDLIAPLVELKSSLTGDVVSLSPSTNVGTIRVGDLRIDVKPRLTTTDLVTLIRYAYEGDCVQARSEVDPDRDGLDELLCRVLADELDMIRQRGVSRLYVNRNRSLNALRGRPDFLASFPWNSRGMTSIACRYHEMSCDTLDNRLVLAALDCAVLMDVHPTTRGRLNAHRYAWHELASLQAVSLADFEQSRSKYSRLTEHYRLAHHIGQMIVMRLKPRSLFESAAIVTAGIALDMADLFERAVNRLLRDSLEPLGYSVRFQRTDSHALHDGEGEKYRNVRPDVLIFRDGQPVAVVDAKYKDYWEADREKPVPINRVSNEDLYQLFFYASRLQAVHHLLGCPAAAIISPVASLSELNGRNVIADRFRRIDYIAGQTVSSLSLNFLSLSDLVRELADNNFDPCQCPTARRFVEGLALV